jgi:hypothetical protein
MTVYIVSYDASIDEWEIRKAFDTKEKAEAYVKENTDPGWSWLENLVIDEVEVE